MADDQSQAATKATTEHPVTQEIADAARAIFVEWESGKLSYQNALERMNDLRQIATQSSQPADVAHIELQVGIMQGVRGNLDASIQHFEKARELFTQMGNRRSAITCLMNVGESYRLKGTFTLARQYFHNSYEAAKAINLRAIQAYSRLNEAQMLISMERYDQAGVMLDECYELMQSPFEDPELPRHRNSRIGSLCETVYAQAKVRLALNKVNEAWKSAAESYKLAKELNVPLRLGFANRILGEVLTALGQPPEEGYSSDPDTYFQIAADAFREVKADGEIAQTLFAHGRSLAKRGKRDLAARKMQQATVIFTKLGMMDDAAKAAEAQMTLT